MPNTKTTRVLGSDEPLITVNGIPLTIGQSMTMRVALQCFAMTLCENGIADSPIEVAYKERVEEINNIMKGSATW